TTSPLQPTLRGEYDAFVAKVDPAGSALTFSTYLGGSRREIGRGIAVDVSGSAYAVGETASSDFPTMNPLQPRSSGAHNAFITKFNPAGAALDYATYLGGSGRDSASAVVVDGSGNAYVTGETSSPDFPTAAPLQATLRGFNDAFVAKLNSAGSALV